MASSATAVKMGRIRRTVATLRNHWKKSTLAAVLASYGVQQVIKKNAEFRMMTAYCKEAESHGDRPVGRLADPPYHVTVILNPASDGGKGRNKYENYCEPLLHLAGFKVSTVRTEGRGQAKDIVEKLDKSDAVLVAGGDGTVMEAVTGLMRRPDREAAAAKKVPLGILPVGKNNLTAKSLFPGISNDVELMAEASMSVVRGFTKKQDLIQVENVSRDTIFSGKKIYCLRQFEMGPWIDAKSRVDKFWYLPFIKKYATYVFTYFSGSKNVLRNCSGDLQFGRKIEAEAEEAEAERTGFWSYIVPTSSAAPAEIEKKAEIEWEERKKVRPTEMVARIAEGSNDRLTLNLRPEKVGLTDFVSEGWDREYNGRFEPREPGVQAEAVRWSPDFESAGEEDDKFFYVDDEAVEIMGPVELTVISKKFRMFCSKEVRDPVPGTGEVSAPKMAVLKRRMESASFSNRF